MFYTPDSEQPIEVVINDDHKGPHSRVRERAEVRQVASWPRWRTRTANGSRESDELAGNGAAEVLTVP